MSIYNIFQNQQILQPSSQEMFQCVLKGYLSLKRAAKTPPATCFHTVYRNLSNVYKILGGVNYTGELGLFLYIFLQGFLKLASGVQ